MSSERGSTAMNARSIAAKVAKDFPDLTDRETAFRQLIRSVDYAESIAPGAWGVTPKDFGFRLNVGRVEVLVASNEFVRMNLVGLKGRSPFVGPRFHRAGYRSVPDPKCAYAGPIREFAALVDVLRSPHFDFIRAAGTTKYGEPIAGSNHRKSHSEAYLNYARSFVESRKTRQRARAIESTIPEASGENSLTSGDRALSRIERHHRTGRVADPFQVQVLSVPAGGTSEFIDRYHVHAFPDDYNYARPHSHLAYRLKGGSMEFVYRIDSKHVFDPDGPIPQRIRGEVRRRIKSYVDDRGREFGFGDGGPYRFYVLSESDVILLRRKPSLPRQRGHSYLSLAELTGLIPSKILEFQPDLPENLVPEDADSNVDDAAFELGALGLTDTRELVTRQILERRGQATFRDRLCRIFSSRCVVTGCEIVDILEAAHVAPYRGDDCNHPSNGLLLRADIHTLFDLSLLGIDPSSLTVALHPRAKVDGYRHLEGVKIACGSAAINRSSLEDRWKLFLAKLQDET